MKLNRGLVLAATLVVGSVAVAGGALANEAQEPANEQASVAEEQGAEKAASNAGTEQYARWGHHGGRHHGEHRGWAHRGRWGHGREGRRAWWRFW